MRPSWNERYLPVLLTIIAGLLGAIIIELAILISPGLPTANAQIPDSGLQRKELIDGVERINQKLDGIRDVLRTQTLRVQVIGTESDKRPAPTTPAKPAVSPRSASPR